MRVETFAEIETEFIERVHSRVWCSFTTIDTKNRPRSRVLHPMWEGSTGWICTTHKPNSLKAKHLAKNPYVSLTYLDVSTPVYVDCRAEWVEDMETKERIWNLFKDTPEPVGYDPAPFFTAVDHENFGVLKLTPWRIELTTFPAPSYEEGTKIWKP